MYIYPENLKAKATLWLWTLRDITIIGAAAFLSIVILAQTGVIIPLVLTFLYAFLCIRVEHPGFHLPRRQVSVFAAVF